LSQYPYDEFSKNFLETLCKPLGEVQSAKTVANEPVILVITNALIHLINIIEENLSIIKNQEFMKISELLGWFGGLGCSSKRASNF
jgi:hypothetical protein